MEIDHRMISSIYCLGNLIDNHEYKGQTINYKARKRQHFSDLRCGTHKNPYLQNAFNKYGEENFYMKELFIINGTQEEINDAETIEIKKIPEGMRYNIALTGGCPMWNREHTVETRQQMSQSRIGKKHTEESKKVMSDLAKGRTIGSNNGRTKLTEELVREIRFKHLADGILTQKQIGELYGVHQNTIGEIKYNKNWKHITK